MMNGTGSFTNSNGTVFDFVLNDYSCFGTVGEPLYVTIKGYIVDKKMKKEKGNEKNGETKKGEVKLKRVIFSNPATIAFWSDGTKTVVKCEAGDEYSEKIGLALCYLKKLTGNKSQTLNDIVKGKCVRQKKKEPVAPAVYTEAE